MYTSFLNNLELIVLELDLGPRELLELSHGSGSYWCPWAGKQPWIKGARLPANSVDWNRKRLIMGSGGSLINLLSLGQPARAWLHFVCSMQKGQAGAQEGECLLACLGRPGTFTELPQQACTGTGKEADTCQRRETIRITQCTEIPLF